MKNLSYSNYVGDGIGYVHLERFSRGGGDELRLAIKELKLKGTIKGMILDLRDNPGGLLDEAVDVVEKFVPKGSQLSYSPKGGTRIRNANILRQKNRCCRMYRSLS